jgi:hypothetical protein
MSSTINQLSIKHRNSQAIDIAKFNIVECTFSVFVDQPYTGHSSRIYYLKDAGHTFFKFHCSHKEIIPVMLQKYLYQYIGYYPSRGLNPLTNKTTANGKFVMPDISHLGGDPNNPNWRIEAQYTWFVSLDDIVKGLNYCKNLQDSPGEFNLDSNNCTDVAIKAGAASGVCVPDPQGEWGNGRGSNPGLLGEELRKLPIYE